MPLIWWRGSRAAGCYRRPSRVCSTWPLPTLTRGTGRGIPFKVLQAMIVQACEAVPGSLWPILNLAHRPQLGRVAGVVATGTNGRQTTAHTKRCCQAPESGLPDSVRAGVGGLGVRSSLV